MEEKCKNQPFLELMQTSKAVQERMRAEIAKHHLSITDFSVLEVLYFKGIQTIQQIGHSILVSSGSMTYVLDKLEQKGLLTRNDCPEDRRVIHVALTGDGNDLMKKIMPNHQKLIDYMFGSLNHDEEQTLTKLLKKVSNRIKA